MVLLNVDFHSDVLGHATSMKVLMPEDTSAQTLPDGTYRTLYLLHGLSDDHNSWSRKSCIERYAARYDMAVIMPNAERSYYMNTRAGDRFEEHIFKEIPAVAHSLFRRLSDRREDTFIAGFSMGGYGAIKGALKYPDRFRAAACFSAHADFCEHLENMRGWDLFQVNFGSVEEFVGSDDDVRVMIPKVAKSGAPLPDFFVSCGTADELIGHSRNIRDMLTENGYNVVYGETEGAGHTWDFWDEEIQKALKFFAGLSK